MWIDILPDLLRGSTSTVCLLILLPILSRKKLKPLITWILIPSIMLIDLLICAQLYMTRNYTVVLYYSLAFYVVFIVGLKLLLKDSWLQWLFNSVTVLNTYAIIVIASFYLCYLFPQPAYANIVIRLVLFSSAIVFFKKILRPLYLEVSENWGAFLLPTSGILVGYLYILTALDDVESSMNQHTGYFYLLILITLLTYSAILLSLKSLRGKFLLREENIRRQANEWLLKSEIASYESTVITAKQIRHDIRHHNAIIAEYLNSEDLKGALDYLALYESNLQEQPIKNYSKHPTTNAVFRLFERRARQKGIKFSIQAEADHYYHSDGADVGIMLSNLLENALSACQKCQLVEKSIVYRSTLQNGSLLVEIENSFEGNLEFENGLPKTTKPGGGTGLKSVVRMVENYPGMITIQQGINRVIVQMIFPIETPQQNA